MSLFTVLIRIGLTVYLRMLQYCTLLPDTIIKSSYLSTVWSIIILGFNTLTVYPQYTQVFDIGMLQEHVCKRLVY